MKSRVFVVQEPMKSNAARTMDLSPAFRYGELVFLVPSGTVVQDWSGVIARMREMLKDFSDDDWIVPTGHPIAIAIAGHLAASANEGRVKFLRWHNGRLDYEPCRVSIWDGMDTAGAPVLGSPVRQ